MAEKITREIKDNFEKFSNLCKSKKIIEEDIIYLKEKENKKDWTIGNSITQNDMDFDDLLFVVEQKKLDKKYQLKFRCQTFCRQPYFRFDSDGPAHRNYDLTIPLEEQMITTPHFNSYNKDGVSIAYKNDVLRNEENAKIICDDINFGISLFCQETNSISKNEDYPKALSTESTLDYNFEEMVNFENLNFE